MAQNRTFKASFVSAYPMYVAKAGRRDYTKEEVDGITYWLTDYSQTELEGQLQKQVAFEQSFVEAPTPNPSRSLTTGIVYGVRVEDVEDGLMKEVRYLDKMIDELARGKKMEKILRK